ncbi:hypothetical protein [Nocardia aurantiaca]|uniref:Uncharacterized protein n=1 Tax=Nocardia aurantiaca TaxID=2675850 RepID=A0A6I3KZF4_9NOCA|nr:hypothetical protein [Nocardia aurantiaca]MTE16093.1 hypothetical protein [Nocardia aurantiaca]
MAIILVATLISLLLIFATMRAYAVDLEHETEPKLTVADIQARLAKEPPRKYVPLSRGW